MNQHPQRPRFGLLTATFLAVANMIGTGVFTSLGYQAEHTRNPFALLMLWVTGGVLALCGALCYAELGTRFPRSGGEYHLLSRIYHPALGFLSGWVSVVAGFAAPVAIAAMALASYIHAVFPQIEAPHFAAGAVVIMSVVHCFSFRLGRNVQNTFTWLKLILIALLIAGGFFMQSPQPLSLLPGPDGLSEMLRPHYFISLVYVSFAYTGWNASVYIAGELKNPSVNLPRAIVASTLLVLLLYVLLNYVFLRAVPLPELAGRIEIGFLAAQGIFGAQAAPVISLLIALLMVSTIGAMILIGSRILQTIGEDYRVFRVFSKWSARHTPVRAILFQGVLSLVFIYTSTFESVLVYTTFILILMNNLTVAGVFVTRRKEKNSPNPYRVWGYPFPPLLFLSVNSVIMVYVCLERPADSLTGLGILAAGLALYRLSALWEKERQ